MPELRAPRLLAPWLALTAIAAAPAAMDAGPRDPLYRWTDGDGHVRYTTELARIPLPRRNDATRVALPPEPEPPIPHLGEREPIAAEEGSEAARAATEAARTRDALAPVEAGPTIEPETPSSLDARIAALEREIAADEEILTNHISDPERAARLHESEAIAAIAERLPRLQAELRALRAQREAAGDAAVEAGDAAVEAGDAAAADGP